MMCPVCGKDTAVKDSRPSDLNTIRRRRVCESGHKTTTWESVVDPASALRQRKAKAERQKRYIAQNPEASREAMRRYRLRQSARNEAAASGRPIETIYQAWGVA
jgi:transcriptional regulator NrdR family protein